MFGRLNNSIISGIENNINLLSKISDSAKVVGLTAEDNDAVLSAMRDMNELLYGISCASFNRNDACLKNIYEELDKLIPVWRNSIKNAVGSDIDVTFFNVYECVMNFDAEIISESIINRFKNFGTEIKELYLSLPVRYTFLATRLDYKNDDYSIIYEHINMLKDNIENYKWLYNNLCDNRSKAVLNSIVSYWFDFDLNKFRKANEYLFKDYYDLDIIPYKDDYVLVDCGAYIGDSIVDFVEVFGKYKHIYSFEMSPSIFEDMRNNLSVLSDVSCINKAVGKEKGYINVSDTDGAGNSVGKAGDILVEITSIDEEIKEHIDMIKFDIEGAEQDALIGAKRHIIEEKPILMVSSYHRPADIFEIPLLINSIRDDYKFYMRLNNAGSIWPCDYILIAI